MSGCDDTASDDVPRVPATSVSGTGVITGRVFFDGPVPERKVIHNSPCCPDAPSTLLDEETIVNPNGTLANTFVYLEDGPKTDGRDLPAPTLDQKFCQYVPHVIGVVVNQELKLRSSDPTYHNVKIKPEAEADRNYSTEYVGDTKTTRFLRPGFARSRCDVHSWMSAVIGVFDNPYFTVTDSEGNFKIENVPDGTYMLVARHEKYLSLRQTVTVVGGKPLAVDFRYTPPKP